MKQLARAFRSDLSLTLRSRGIRALVVVVLLAPLAPIGLEGLREASELAQRAVLAGGAPREAAERGVVSAWPLLLDGVRAAWGVAFFSLLAISAHSLAHDRESGWARTLLVAGVSRSSWLVARYASLLLLGVALAILSLASSLGFAACAGDFSAITEDGVEIFSEAEIRREVILALLGAAATLPALVASGVLISSVVRGAAFAVAFAMASAMLWDLVKSTLGPRGSWGYASFHPSPIDTSYLREISQMARGFSDFRDMDPLNLLVPWPTAAVCLALAWCLASRRKL